MKTQKIMKPFLLVSSFFLSVSSIALASGGSGKAAMPGLGDDHPAPTVPATKAPAAKVPAVPATKKKAQALADDDLWLSEDDAKAMADPLAAMPRDESRGRGRHQGVLQLAPAPEPAVKGRGRPRKAAPSSDSPDKEGYNVKTDEAIIEDAGGGSDVDPSDFR